MWRELYQSLEINVTPSPGWKFAPRSTKAILRSFERDCGIVLPQSYRDYAMVFGAGSLAYHAIAAPMGVVDDLDLRTFDHGYKGDDDDKCLSLWIGDAPNSEFLIFSGYELGGFYAWHLTESTDPASHEYVIYNFDPSNKLKKICETFHDFVLGDVLKRRRGLKEKRKFYPCEIKA